jgi:predicted nuclease with RNAse H fold
VLLVEAGVTDTRIVELAGDAAGVGIDAPFGWPEPFAQLLHALRSGEDIGIHPWTDAWRDELRFRFTDKHLISTRPLRPLSVSSERIALAALRCAGILARLGVRDRAADPRVHEIYPAAALSAWGLPSRGYKGAGREGVRRSLLERLIVEPGIVEPSAAQRRLLEDNADALACALVARAAMLGLTESPPQDQRERVMREGWIRVPTCPLAALRVA